MPRGYNAFQYGAGASDWDRKASQDARLQNAGNYKSNDLNGIQHTSDDYNVSAGEGASISEEDYVSMKRRQAQLPHAGQRSNLVPAFPGASSIVAPRGTLNDMGISMSQQVPMNSLISQSDNKFIQRARNAGVRKASTNTNWNKMTNTSGSEIAKMTDDQMSTAFFGGRLF